MGDVTQPQSLSTDHQATRPRRTLVLRLLIVTGLILIVLVTIAFHVTTRPLGLTDGRRYEMIRYVQERVALYHPKTGQWEHENRLVVQYYSAYTEMNAMRAEARTIAPAFFRIADSLGLKALLMQPAKPLLLRSFPLVTWSWDVRYEPDSTGAWTERDATHRPMAPNQAPAAAGHGRLTPN